MGREPAAADHRLTAHVDADPPHVPQGEDGGVACVLALRKHALIGIAEISDPLPIQPGGLSHLGQSEAVKPTLENRPGRQPPNRTSFR